jgi:hypothetical protein
MSRRLVVITAALIATAMAAPATAAPTCAGIGGIANHGEHVVGDYVTGTGGIFNEGMTWPPSGQVGSVVGGNRGPVAPGGPAAGGHFNVDGLAPGASFCVEQRPPFTTPGPFTD